MLFVTAFTAGFTSFTSERRPSWGFQDIMRFLNLSPFAFSVFCGGFSFQYLASNKNCSCNGPKMKISLIPSSWRLTKPLFLKVMFITCPLIQQYSYELFLWNMNIRLRDIRPRSNNVSQVLGLSNKLIQCLPMLRSSSSDAACLNQSNKTELFSILTEREYFVTHTISIIGSNLMKGIHNYN